MFATKNTVNKQLEFGIFKISFFEVTTSTSRFNFDPCFFQKRYVSADCFSLNNDSMRRSYLKEHRPVLYASLLTSGTLHRHLAEIDQACNERMAIIVSDMARQEDVTEALKAADQMEWVRRMNSIRNRAEEIVLTELVYE